MARPSPLFEVSSSLSLGLVPVLAHVSFSASARYKDSPPLKTLPSFSIQIFFECKIASPSTFVFFLARVDPFLQADPGANPPSPETDCSGTFFCWASPQGWTSSLLLSTLTTCAKARNFSSSFSPCFAPPHPERASVSVYCRSCPPFPPGAPVLLSLDQWCDWLFFLSRPKFVFFLFTLNKKNVQRMRLVDQPLVPLS